MKNLKSLNYIYRKIILENRIYKITEDKENLINELNKIFEEEHVPYRIVKDNSSGYCYIIRLTNKEEIKEIENVFNLPEKYKPVQEHLNKALKLYSDRKNPDYENSIKESISAVESLAQIILGERGTLGQLIKELPIENSLKRGFSSLYGWTSAEHGIRHGKANASKKSLEAEARYMLVTCSAFINYVIAKLSESKNDK